MRLFFMLMFVTISLGMSNAQSDTLFNQTDANNLKQGWWKKTYPEGKTMYKGFFKDDKPVGPMYRYFETGALKAILVYDSRSEYAHAKMFYQDGQLAAEGVFFNSLKDSTWSYYSYFSRTLTAKETYRKGVRNGLMISYYPNGAISEKLEWKNDKKEGIWEQYFMGGVLKMKGQYLNDKLEGSFLVNHNDGKPYVTGIYENGQRQGKWKFLNNDGSLETELEYQHGKLLDEDKVNEKQQELFRNIDASEGKFKEPDESNFLSPPGR